MVHDCYAVVSGISKYCTLHPGDIILTGAPRAVGQINPGDVVEVEIPGIGATPSSGRNSRIKAAREPPRSGSVV